MLLDAATLSVAADAIVSYVHDPASVNIEAQPSERLLEALAQLEAPVANPFDAKPQDSSQPQVDINAILSSPGRREVIFIDNSLPGYSHGERLA